MLKSHLVEICARFQVYTQNLGDQQNCLRTPILQSESAKIKTHNRIYSFLEFSALSNMGAKMRGKHCEQTDSSIESENIRNAYVRKT